MRVRRVTETPIEFDKHRGMAAQKATDIRRGIAEVEANAKLLRDKQGVVKSRSSPHGHLVARGGGQGALRAQPVFRRPAAADTHHRDLVSAVLADLTRLSGKRPEQTSDLLK